MLVLLLRQLGFDSQVSTSCMQIILIIRRLCTDRVHHRYTVGTGIYQPIICMVCHETHSIPLAHDYLHSKHVLLVQIYTLIYIYIRNEVTGTRAWFCVVSVLKETGEGGTLLQLWLWLPCYSCYCCYQQYLYTPAITLIG